MPIFFEKFTNLLKNNLFKSGSIYTASSIIEKAIPFLLLPVLTRYLSTADYGIVSMFTVLVGLTLPFTGYNSHAAILRIYFKDDIDIPVYISNALFILIGSSIIAAFIVFIFSDFIAFYSKFPENWLFTVILIGTFQFLVNVILVVWQGQDKAIHYGVFRILLTALNIGLAVLLIVGLGYGWEGVVVGKTTTIVLFGIMAIVVVKNNGLLKFKFKKKYIKHALYYGVPLIPHVLSGFIIAVSDRVFITNMVGINETGIYSVGYQVGMIIVVLAGSFNKAWTPWLYSKLNDGDSLIKKKIVKFTYIYIFTILCLALFLSMLAPWFMKFLVGQNFYGATKYIIWIAFGYAFNGMYFMVASYIFYVEKTHLLSWMTFSAALTNVVLNYIFILYFGAIGAAQATTLTYVILFILTWILASRVYKMPWLFWLKKNDEYKD